MRRIDLTERDYNVLSILAVPSSCDAVRSLFPSKQTMYRRIAKLVRHGLLRRIEGSTVPTRTRSKEVYCSAAETSAA
jgi:DeoR/GlpR family transcriptional regulator of sugar metabolism